MTSLLVYWPACLLLLGLLEFTLTLLLAGPRSTTYGFSVLLAGGLALVALFRSRETFKVALQQLFKEWSAAPLLFKILTFLVLGILILSGFEARLPPHLGQESDAIRYHMGLARQHLLAGSSKHLSWSAADLWPMPLQWGSAPLWFFRETFNKLPQYLMSVWLGGLMLQMGRSRLSGYRGWIPALAVLSTHGVVIQLGTAMMDLPALYMLLGVFHAAERNRWGWSALHLAFFSTQKSFAPFITLAIFTALFLWGLFQYRSQTITLLRTAAPALGVALLLSLLFLCRSISVSWGRAGTPLAPFFTCQDSSVKGCQGEEGQRIRESSRLLLETRDQYGNGRTPTAWVLHLWRVAVPTQGVNNEYDYPLGLAWVLWVVFLIASFWLWVKGERPNLYIVAAISFWVLWWMGSQQARWLYPVLAFGWLGTLLIQKRCTAQLLNGLLIVSAVFSFISQYRALRPTLFHSSGTIQNEQFANQKWDPQIDTFLTQYILYADRVIERHGFGDRRWFLD